MSASSDNRTIAHTMATAFGVKPIVQKYWDDSHELNVDVLTCPNPVDANRMNYGTIGLSDYPLLLDGEEFPLRVEVVGAAFEEFGFFPNMLSTIAFHTVRDGWFCSSGAVLQGAITMYDDSLIMKHLLLTPPFLWEDNLETVGLETKRVTWLMAVPISEEERAYYAQYGSEALEELLERNEVDVCDLRRKSVV